MGVSIMMTSRSNCGEALRRAQFEYGVSNVQLARDLGVPRQEISRWRSQSDWRLSRVVQMSERFGLSIEDFVSLGR